MRILLDTHVALWAITDDERLPTRVRELILEARNEVYVSAASVWEIAIKHSLAREDMPVSGTGLFQDRQCRHIRRGGGGQQRTPVLHAAVPRRAASGG